MNTSGNSASQSYFADYAWLAPGWAANTRIEVGAALQHSGLFISVEKDRAADQAEHLGRYVLPGMPNLHSHAFQRAMAGLAERQTHAEDSFWTWRETMYAFAGRVDPDSLQAIAAQVYVEMLKAGYTHVCEFHYLHHQADGTPYADPAAMSLALIEAAKEAGIGLTLLPTLYMTGGFDGRGLHERQSRFFHNVEKYMSLLQKLRALESSQLRIGIALHSLRAVPPEALRQIVESEFARDCPIHIHVAEQIGEVQDCLAYRNARPVEWLLANAPLDARWCLVHATHMTEDETLRLAASGAIAGLCPTTEANLGDGLFPLKTYLDAGGTLGIGSDSHISISPIEELRWLEYGQRLQSRHRNIAVSELSESVGETLWGNTLFGGALAAGVAIGELDAGDPAQSGSGMRADLLVLDDDSPLLAARTCENVIDSMIFAGNQNPVRHVMAAGRWVVRDFHHHAEDRIAQRYCKTVQRLARIE
jgi:formimidoylglutamate deiminase